MTNDQSCITAAPGSLFADHPTNTVGHRSLVIGRFAAPAALWLVGMAMAFYPVFLSGFVLVSGDRGDARLTNYLLEHSWRWVRREPLHRDLWGPPFFYPEPNVAAYSDVLLSAAPLYWPWRALGVAPGLAYEFCLMGLATLNYLAAYLFARRCLRFPSGAAAFAAFLFAFASPRLIHLCHSQLHVHFWSVLSLFALYRLLEGEPVAQASRLGRTGGTPVLRGGGWYWVPLFFLGVVAQFYGSFYLGWFLGIGLAVALAWALGVPVYRARLAAVVRRHRWGLCGWGLPAGLALGDLGRHYLEAARTAGYQEDWIIRVGIPYFSSWWSRGEGSWFNLTSGLIALGVVPRNPWPGGEHALGLGPITYTVAFVGLYRLRHLRLVRVLFAAGLTLFVCMTALAPDVSLWQYLYHVVPGGGAVRALSRLGLIFLLPLALCAAWAVKELAPRRPGLAVLLVFLCCLEQGQTHGGYDRHRHRRDIEQIAAAVPRDAETFFLAPVEPLQDGEIADRLQVDAIWVQLATGVPTVNGYSGRAPAGWEGLYDATVGGPTDVAHVEALLRRWLPGRRAVAVRTLDYDRYGTPIRVYIVP